MHEDAERRMSDFLQQLHRPRSIASRVQEMLPLIDEARTRGATWPEISEVLGVPRSTLLAAYSRARKSSGGKAKARGGQRVHVQPGRCRLGIAQLGQRPDLVGQRLRGLQRHLAQRHQARLPLKQLLLECPRLSCRTPSLHRTFIFSDDQEQRRSLWSLVAYQR